VYELAQHHISEKIHDGDSSVIYRAKHTQTDKSVVLKFLKSGYPSHQLLYEFAQEYSITASFQSDRIVKTYSLEKHNNSLVMILEDCGSVTLASMIDTVRKNIAWALDIAIQLTKVLMEIHQRDIVHGDLNTSNIMYNGERQSIALIDFGSARIGREAALPGTATDIFKTALPYVSPEQTGHYSKDLDYRTDLYSLGITLYQLFTGKLPFLSADPMELIHLHLATPPVPPHITDPTIPEILSNIILKLIQKSRRPRYQTCAGLLVDLDRCREEWRAYHTINKFTLGENDLPDKLVFPKKLFNRKRELTFLQKAVPGDTEPAPAVIAISGYSGIGKTALVHEFKNSLLPTSCRFLTGQYDVGVMAKPHGALADIMRTLVNTLLTGSTESNEKWKKRIKLILGKNSRILVDLVPELEILTGKQTHPPSLSPYETEQRLTRLFVNFIQLFASKDKPLIIFLDDLHRADYSTLKLIEQLTTSKTLNNVLFIFCFRDNETDKDHPLTAALNAIKQAGTNLRTLQLPPLEIDDVTQLLSTTLLQPEERVIELAGICLQKTGGNPFFLKQFVHSLHRTGNIQLDQRDGGWNWDVQAINRTDPTKNIAELLAQRIQTVQEESALLLKHAACIGRSFTLKILTATVNISHEEVWRHLQELFFKGLLIHDKVFPDEKKGSRLILFSHYQIQQVSYSLLTEKEKGEIHLKLGRYLQKEAKELQQGEYQFDIVNHLNRAIAQINSPPEQLNLIAANLTAGRRAKDTASYGVAHSFLQTGLSLLPEKYWEIHYHLALELHTEACEAAYLDNEYGEMERLFGEVCSKASSLLDKTGVYHIRIRAQKSHSQLPEALETGREILTMLGVRLPNAPSRLQAAAKFIETRIFMSRWKTSDLLNLPEMKDPYKIEAMRFLVDIGTVAYHVRQELLPFISTKAIRLSLKYGNTASAGQVAYPLYSLLLCAAPGGNIQKGYRYGQLALNLQQRFSPEGVSPSTIYVVTIMTIHWRDHLRETLKPLLTALKGCSENGEFEYAALAAHSYSYRLYYLGFNLDKAMRELTFYRRKIKKYGQQIALHRQNIYCQAMENLAKKIGSPERFDGDFYNEKEMVPIHKAAGDNTTLFKLYLLKTIHCFLFDKYDESLTCSNRARKRLQSVLSSVNVPIFHFYDSLVRLTLYNNSSKKAQTRHRYRIGSNQRKLKRWARHSPNNYQHKYDLVEAEREKIKGHFVQAMNLYDSAIDLARTNGFLQEEALAFELASRFYLSLNKPHLARPYMREARYCYYRWGATAKVSHLDRQELPKVSNIARQPITPDIIPETFIPGTGGPGFDMATVVKASRILTGETTFPELLKKVMKIMLESSGAQRGVLVFNEKERWQLKIAGSTEKNGVELLDNVDLDSQGIVSSAIINYVIQTKNDLILNDARREGMFIDDEYVTENSPRSILCSPLTHRGKVECILYLENNLTTRAFSQGRQELLHLLGNQAAINIRNSRLFNKLELSIKKINREVEIRRNIQLQLLHSEKLSALGRLASSIAHEFGNPLIGIKYLLTDFIERPFISKEDQRLLLLGMEECDRMKKLLKNLGQLNRPTTGKRSLGNIHKIMDNVLFFQAKQIRSQQLKIVKNYASDLPDVFVIQDQISQVLLNLTINAADAISASGGTITVTTWKTAAKVFFSIADTGKGIDQNIQGNIFEPFFSTKREEDGTGLGLSTSYGIIKQHRGKLTFASEPDKGTTFTISLPRTTTQPQ